jgi:hypothetical protein
MRLSDEPRPRPARPIDWRGWVLVVWVVWFGLLYARMVIEQRSQRFREMIKVSGTPGDAGPDRSTASRVASP